MPWWAHQSKDLSRHTAYYDHLRRRVAPTGQKSVTKAKSSFEEEGSHWNERTSYGRERKRWLASGNGLLDAINLVARARSGEEDADVFRLLQHHAMQIGQRRVEMAKKLAYAERNQSA